MKLKWLFVVSTSYLVGRGHLNRSIALASEMQKKSYIDFYSYDEENFSSKFRENKNIKFYNSELNEIDIRKYNGVVIDIKKYDKLLKIKNIKTIISPSLEKRDKLEKYQSALLGRKYYLIPSRYKKQKKIINKNVKNILINFGYLDSKNLTLNILDSLNNINYEYKVIVLIGENQSLLKKIKKKKYKFELKVYSGLTDLRSFYRKVDLCIGAGGVGMIERFLYSLPSVNIPSSNDQYYALSKAQKKNATIFINYDNKKKFNLKFKKILVILLKNKKIRKILSENAYAYTDNKGSQRVAKYLLNIE